MRSRVQAIVRARDLNLIGGTPAAPAEASVSSISNLPEPENPYKGLRAFQPADADDFFGREELTQKLLNRMKGVGTRHAVSDHPDNGRFLAVVGPSGSGKSSVVKAGLIPALWRGDLPGSERWFVVEMLPGAHPLDRLEVALLRVAANQSGNLNAQLARDGRGLLRVADLILPNDGSDLVLVIDQFEEVFTLVEDEAERQHFLNLMTTAAQDPRSRVRIVITLRADFYDRPLNYPEFGDLVRSYMETVLPLSAKGLERAISGPAQRVGVRFEEGLVASIVSEMNYQAGALPLLQYALTELFERREGRLLTQQAYQEIGGAVGALAKRAEDLFRDLTPEGQEAARQMFLRLVTLGEGVEDTRRRTPRAELLAIGVSPSPLHKEGLETPPLYEMERGLGGEDLMDEIIDAFAAYRLLTLDNDLATRTPTVELAHEAILREWERLRAWLNESRQEIRLQRQLAAMAADWREANGDKSFLATGSRLEQFEQWAKDTKLALTPDERAYLAASLAERERQHEAEMERQARERALERRVVRFLRTLVGVLLLATVGAFGLSGVAMYNANEAQAARAISEENLQRSEALRLASAANVLLPGNVSNAELAALLAIRSLNSIYSPEAEAALVQASRLLYTQQLFVTPQDAMWVDAAYLPDGLTLMTFRTDNSLVLTNIATGEERVGFTGIGEGLRRFVFSPDGQMMATVSFPVNDRVRLWDMATGELRLTLHTGFNRVSDPAFSPDGRTIATAGLNDSIRLWDVNTGAEVATLLSPMPRVDAVGFSHSGRFLAAGLPGYALLYDLETAEIIQRFEGHTSFVFVVAFSSDDGLLLTSSADGTARLWDVATGEELRRFSGHTARVSKAVFSPDGRYVLTASDDGTARLWNAATGEELRRFSGHEGDIFNGTLQFSPDGAQMITSRLDNTIRLWDARLDHEPDQLVSHVTKIDALALSPDGRWAIAGTEDGTTWMWNLATLELVYRLDESVDEGPHEAVFSPDSRYFLTATASGALLRETATGQVVRRFGETAMSVAISPDGQTALIGGSDGSVGLWDIVTGQSLRQFDPLTVRVWTVAFSPDGRMLLASSIDSGGVLQMWDAATGQPLAQLTEAIGPTSAAEFSPDGQFLLTGEAGFVHLWDLSTGQEVNRFETGNPGLIYDLAFSQDGRWALASSSDGTVWLWEPATGQGVRRLSGHESLVKRVGFSVDGRWVLTASLDGTVRLWHRDYHDLINATCARIFRDFDAEERAFYHILDNEPTCQQFASVNASS